MRKLTTLLLLISLFSLVLTGCGDSAKKDMQVTLEGADQFPDYLVGKWVANKGGWEITFAENGKIEKITHTLGRVDIKPGKKTTVPMRMDGTSYYIPGEWEVIYSGGDTEELTVIITVKDFYAEIGAGVVEGSSRDIFAGKISDDRASWLVDWTSFPDYTAHTDEHPNFKMTEEGEQTTKGLIFTQAESN
jgi:hypothetical protein